MWVCQYEMADKRADRCSTCERVLGLSVYLMQGLLSTNP